MVNFIFLWLRILRGSGGGASFYFPIISRTIHLLNFSYTFHLAVSHNYCPNHNFRSTILILNTPTLVPSQPNTSTTIHLHPKKPLSKVQTIAKHTNLQLRKAPNQEASWLSQANWCSPSSPSMNHRKSPIICIESDKTTSPQTIHHKGSRPI